MLLKHYLQDGASNSVRAVLAYLQGFSFGNITIEIGRWENGREQGYVVMYRGKKQYNIAFFEHRNSDSLCALDWKQYTMNSPSIETIEGSELADKYLTKSDIDYSVAYDRAYDMAEWIHYKITEFIEKEGDN